MPKFSDKSAARLATCHPDIQAVLNEVIKYRDCTILEGVRTIGTNLNTANAKVPNTGTKSPKLFGASNRMMSAVVPIETYRRSISVGCNICCHLDCLM